MKKYLNRLKFKIDKFAGRVSVKFLRIKKFLVRFKEAMNHADFDRVHWWNLCELKEQPENIWSWKEEKQIRKVFYRAVPSWLLFQRPEFLPPMTNSHWTFHNVLVGQAFPKKLSSHPRICPLTCFCLRSYAAPICFLEWVRKKNGKLFLMFRGCWNSPNDHSRCFHINQRKRL